MQAGAGRQIAAAAGVPYDGSGGLPRSFKREKKTQGSGGAMGMGTAARLADSSFDELSRWERQRRGSGVQSSPQLIICADCVVIIYYFFYKEK